MPLGIAGAVGGDAEALAAEHLRRRPGEVGAVDAAAVGDDERRQLGEQVVAGLLLLRSTCWLPPALGVPAAFSAAGDVAHSSQSSPFCRRPRHRRRRVVGVVFFLHFVVVLIVVVVVIVVVDGFELERRVLVTSRLEPHSGQLIRSPLSTSNSSTSISASHSGQVAIQTPRLSSRLDDC